MVSEHHPPDATPMSLEAWGDLPEDEPGELVDGLLVEEEMPNWIHEISLERSSRSFAPGSCREAGSQSSWGERFPVS
jgi:hypothetical protein